MKFSIFKRSICELLSIIVKLYTHVDDCGCELSMNERLISEWFDLLKDNN